MTNHIDEGKNRIMRALLTAMALMATPAAACDAIALHGFSYHSDRDLIRDVNEFNIGAGCQFDISRGTVEIGMYQNSFSNMSKYAIYDFRDGFTPFIGLATGYEDMKSSAMLGDLAILGGVAYVGPVTVRAAPSYSQRTGKFGGVFSVSFVVVVGE